MVTLKERTVEPKLGQLHIRNEIAAQTDTGRLRKKNEDAFGTLKISIGQEQNRRELGILAIADGIGGNQKGYMAANIAISNVIKVISSSLPDIVSVIPKDILLWGMLDNAVRQANQNIISANTGKINMGSTLLAALLIDKNVYIANVGNSRAYLFDGNHLRQITSDHSLAWMLASCGQIKKEEIHSHPQRNILIRSLGSSKELVFDIFSERLEAGHQILLCTNGLWEMVSDGEIESVLYQDMSSVNTVNCLIDLANSKGGLDNITAIIIKATQSLS